MDIRYSGRNIDVTEGMKEHLHEKLLKLERYAPKIIEAHIVLEKERYLFEAEVTLLAKDLRAFGEASSKENMFAAIDQACARVEKQLKKFREKVKDHHKKGVEEVTLPDEYQEITEGAALDAATKTSKVVPSTDIKVSTMSSEEASLQLDLSEKSFIVFFNPSSQKVNVLYKRDDGHHGLIEPNN